MLIYRDFDISIIRSVTTTDTCTPGDRVLHLSGASFDQTLYTAVGNKGRRIRIHHTGTSLSQLYTLKTTGGQTLGGIASGSFILSTNGEMAEFESDNANWILVGRYARTSLSSSSAIGLTAVSGGLVKGTTSADGVRWARDGQFVDIIYDYVQTGAGTAGTGNYLFALPTGIEFDSNLISFYTTAVAQNAAGKSLNYVGNGYISYGAVTNGAAAYCFAYDATKFRAGGIDSTNPNMLDGASNYGVANANANYHFKLRFPVSGWQP